MVTYWKIYSRYSKESKKHYDFADICYKNDIITLGWNYVGDLNRYKSSDLKEREKLKVRIAQMNNWDLHKKNRSIGSYSSSLLSFAFDLKINDVVLCPSKSGVVYVGRVRRKSKYYFDRGVVEGICDFAHRRKIDWFRVLNDDETRFIWPDKEFGGKQTVSRIENNIHRLKSFLNGKLSINKTKANKKRLTWKPDKEWGRQVELRAIKWLKEQEYKPIDVADECKGWDIECDNNYFEVKGRKSRETIVRLTKNEWNAARMYKKKYSLLIFTASNQKLLDKAEPLAFPNPAESLEWKVIYEPQYLLKDV